MATVDVTLPSSAVVPTFWAVRDALHARLHRLEETLDSTLAGRHPNLVPNLAFEVVGLRDAFAAISDGRHGNPATFIVEHCCTLRGVQLCRHPLTTDLAAHLLEVAAEQDRLAMAAAHDRLATAAAQTARAAS